MGFFSVPHNMACCLSDRKKFWNLKVSEKVGKTRQTLDKLKNYHSFRVAGAQILVNVF